MNEDKDTVESWIDGEHLYIDPDYIEGSHPMDTDDVTWHHQWRSSRNGSNNASETG